MDKIRASLLWVFVAALSTGVFTSCDPDDYDDYGYLSGQWYYEGSSDGSYYDSDYNEFFLAPDGTGSYSCYSDGGYGPWTTYAVYWWTNGDFITIQVAGWDQWTYRYSVSPRWLYLYPSDGGPYLIYSN